MKLFYSMQRFTNLFLQLDRTNKTNEKVDLLKSYFETAPDEDRIWALALFTGRRPPRKIKTSQIQLWAIEEAQIPEWLFYECYDSVGDLAETISLVLPRNVGGGGLSLDEWFERLSQIDHSTDEQKRELITEAWKRLSAYEIFVFNKLLMGSFRIGVSQTLVIRAIGEVFNIAPSVISHRVMGKWDPYLVSFNDLIHKEDIKDELSKPYPFYLAYAVEGSPEDLGDPDDWMAEWKWDGIRSEIILRKGEFYIWSRGEELVTEKFPELEVLKTYLPDNTVLDGELICIRNHDITDHSIIDWRPMPFNVLQTRIGRKNISKKILETAPVAFIAYDILEYEGKDIRGLSQEARRSLLREIHDKVPPNPVFKISPIIEFSDWDQLKNLHLRSREFAAEGFMIKRKKAAYQVGRKKGDWWKWKVDPLSVDAVLVYAQKGSGRRAELFTDYTFAIWEKDKLISFAKAYSGLTDTEIKEVDRFVKQNTLEKFGPVRTVKPELVFEIGFEGINESTRHKSGIAVRFPRILRWRKDKTAKEADTLENLKLILEKYK